MLESMLRPLLASSIASIAVVIHEGIAAGLSGLSDPRILLARNNDPQLEMIDSIRIGLAALRGHCRIGEGDGVLVCPADHPGIAAADVDRCVGTFLESQSSIVIAARDGRRGHPIIFPADDIPFVESAACDQGLNALPRQHADRIVLAACDSPGVCRDVDTPEDYRSLP